MNQWGFANPAVGKYATTASDAKQRYTHWHGNITIRQAIKSALIAKREQLDAAADTPRGFHSGPQEHDMLDLELAHLEKECGQAQEELDRQVEAE
jgi:hypothetical protein